MDFLRIRCTARCTTNPQRIHSKWSLDFSRSRADLSASAKPQHTSGVTTRKIYCPEAARERSIRGKDHQRRRREEWRVRRRRSASVRLITRLHPILHPRVSTPTAQPSYSIGPPRIYSYNATFILSRDIGGLPALCQLISSYCM